MISSIIIQPPSGITGCPIRLRLQGCIIIEHVLEPYVGTFLPLHNTELFPLNDLPLVVFHSLHHSSITYKLMLNGGDIKAVQGDSCHAQASMATDQYSHILDENRCTNAELIERAFYEGREDEPTNNRADENARFAGKAQAAGVDPSMLTKLLENPDMVKMLQMLSNSLAK